MNSSQATGRASELPDHGLPGNDLNPNTPTPDQQKKVPFVIKVYGLLCMIDGIVTLPVVAIFLGMIAWALGADPEAISIGTDPTLPVIIVALSIVVTVINSVGLIVFGRSLIKNRRRHAGRWSYLLLATTFVQLLFNVMLSGIGTNLISGIIQFFILLALSITIDPSLREERILQRRLRDLTDQEAAEEGMLGRDLEGKGYIQLNFFNLFWVFMVCCVLGLIIEVIYHMVVVDPGVYQDRAGLLFGPFSPIYGCGAVLLTIALNRFYKANPIIIFIVSAIIGGVFEAFVSWFMQTAFGAVAWDYTGMTLFGIPDPSAIVFQGRTSTPFMCMWGALGFVWIKLCLPWLLKLINMIPWKLRYSLTTVCAVLMLVNAVMTLQALDCWFERVSGTSASTPVEEFYAEHFDNAYMANRFQSMTIHPEDTSRVDDTAFADAMAPESDTDAAGSAATAR